MPKVVILCLENRSFDEYFGTFPGAMGFYDPNPNVQAIFTPEGLAQNGGPLQPFRMSSFSTSSQLTPGMNHDWAHQHQAWNRGNMNGWSTQLGAQLQLPGGSSVDASACTMGYYGSNDIPYRWSLASTFLLCDTYFCSVLGATWSNRSMLMSGTIRDTSMDSQQPPGVVITQDVMNDEPMVANPGNPQNTGVYFPWMSYFGVLGPSASWTIYDDQYWQPAWMAWPQPANLPPVYLGSWPGPWYFNLLDILADGGAPDPVGVSWDTSSGHYSRTAADATVSSFEQAALDGLPGISFILPPFALAEHPQSLPADGDSYLARIVSAVVEGPDWADENVVLIITYDENDGRFDHVAPPTSMAGLSPADLSQPALPISSQTSYTGAPAAPPSSGAWEPWVTTPVTQPPVITGPIGAGFRVPTIIVSPWTCNAGVSSQIAPGARFDHTSVIQYLEDVTQVKCLPNLPEDPPLNWRRQTFSSLGILVDTAREAVSGDDVVGLLPSVAQADRWRANLLTRLYDPDTTPVSLKLPLPSPPPLQTWPPLQQTCSVVLRKTTFSLDEVQAAAEADGRSTFFTLWVVLDGFDPNELNVGALTPEQFAPLAPDITLTVASTGAAPQGMNWTVGSVQPDGLTVPPVPQQFTFPVNIFFIADGDGDYPAFSGVTPGAPALVMVQASFTSNLTWTAPPVKLELLA
jgi:phospholipase C